MLGSLIDLVSEIWRADSKMRDESMLEGSKLDKESKHSVALLCGTAIVLLVIGTIGWRWYFR